MSSGAPVRQRPAEDFDVLNKKSGVWLMKTEPNVFSYDDLLKAKNQTSQWEGVRNYQARNFMRDQFKVGDEVFVYHSSCEVPGIVGLATVAREAYPDLFALDKKSKYFDEKSAKDGESRWVMVDVKAKKKFKEVISLQTLKASKALKDMYVVRPGMRLSIQPVTQEERDYILKNLAT